jgi:hypothetical protein
MDAGSNSTSKKTKALLSLTTAYIKKLSDIVSTTNIDYGVIDKLKKSYYALSDEIKS